MISVFIRFTLVCLFVLSTLFSSAQKNTATLQQAYKNSQWHTVIKALSEKENLTSTELELLVKSYADSASFLQINGIDGAADMYQLAYKTGIKKTSVIDNKTQLAKAIGLFCNNEYETAKTIVAKLLKDNPKNDEYHYWFWSIDITAGNTNYFEHPNLLKGLQLNPTNTDLLLNIGMLYYNNKAYTEATNNLQRCIKANDDFYQRYYLGCVYSQLQDWEKAKENLSICIKQRPDFAIAYYVLGSIEIYNGNVKEAVSAFKTTIDLAPNYYSYVENMKQYYPVLKEYNFIKKVKIRTSVDLLNKATQQSNAGDYAKSIATMKEAIEAFQKESPIDTLMLVSAFNWQMVNYNLTKNYEKSNQLANAILQLPSSSEFQTTEQATIYAYLAKNYQSMGDNDNALKYAVESYQRVKTLEAAKNYRLPSVTNIAFLANESGDYTICETYLKEAKSILATQLFNLEDAMSLLETSVKQKINTKQYDAALKEIATAEKGFNFSTGPHLKRDLNELRFKVYVQRHDIANATKILQTLEKDAHSKGLFTFYYTDLMAEDLTDYWVQLNKNNEAYFVLHQKLTSISEEIILNFPLMNEAGKSLHYTKNNEWLAKYFSYLYLNKDEKLGKNKIIFGANTSNFFKNAIINNNNKVFRFANEQQDEVALAYLDSLKLIKEKLRNSDLLTNERKTYTEQEKAILDFINKRFGFTIRQDFSDFHQYQNILPENDIIVNIAKFNYYDFNTSKFFADSTLYAYIILGKNRETEIRFISNGKALENKWFYGYQNNMKHKINDQHSYEQYFGPIKDIIENNQNIWLIADGVYHFINPNSLYIPSKNKYLIETNNIHLVNKFESNTFQQSTPQFKTATIIGNPNFDETQTEISIALKQLQFEELINEAPMYAYTNTTRSGNHHFSPLPGTQKEIDNIHQTLKNNNIVTTSFSGNNAIEPLVKNKLDGSIIHFATHGIFENTTNNLNASINAGLLLSGANNHLNDPNNDGYLCTEEIDQLILNTTELLVLSACETGKGKALDGQGVFGLQSAFINAGVNQIIMSLWKVDDEATNLLMTSFYSYLFTEKSIDTAFKKAQLHLMTKYPHPYYWGAFILVK